MIVIPKKQALVLKLREPERVTSIIPTAKVVTLKGQQFVALPHKLDEVRVLRNLGIDAPSPIRYYYDYPSGQQRTPFDAQYGTTDFLTTARNAFVLSEMGTGKTISILWTYDYLRSIGEVNKMLVIAPLSTLERTWADEIFMNFPHLSWAVVHGTKDKRMKLLNLDVNVYIINHDGIKTSGFLDAMAERKDIDVIVADEGALLARNAGTDRWKALNKLVNKQGPRRVWWLTGTPTPNKPTDAWAQCKIVAPSTVPTYFNRFRDSVMQQHGPFVWKPRPTAVDTVFSVMVPAVRYTRADCMDLPPCMYQTRHVDMSSEQTAAYKDMQAKLHAEIEEGSITAVNEAVKASKLLQIACGAVYGPGGVVVDIPSQGRIDVLHEIVQEATGKVIVFVPFVGALEKIAIRLAYMMAETDEEKALFVASQLDGKFRDNSKVAIIHGGVSQRERNDIFQNFQREGNPRVLIAQPASMSHGLTLTEANTIVWYSACNSNETYEQANARITRPGQKNNQFIIHLEGCFAERKVYERLKTKQSMQNLLLDLVENQKDSVHL